MKNKIIRGSLLVIIFMVSYSFYIVSNIKNTIVIGTKNFTEQIIIGNIMKNVIEKQTDYNVKVLSGIGETSFLQTAIKKNDIDLSVDYTSTGYEDVLKHHYNGQSSNEIYKIVKSEYEKEFGLDWISLLGFENSNAIICGEFCKSKHITKLSELKKYPNLKIGAPIEFYRRDDGLKLLIKKYQINIRKKNQINMDHSLLYSSLDNDDVDLILGYTTDAQLYNQKYVSLEDDLNVFAKYDAGIIVSNQALLKYPELGSILKQFEQKIDVKTMQKMNYEVDVLGNSINDVVLQTKLNEKI